MAKSTDGRCLHMRKDTNLTNHITEDVARWQGVLDRLSALEQKTATPTGTHPFVPEYGDLVDIKTQVAIGTYTVPANGQLLITLSAQLLTQPSVSNNGNVIAGGDGLKGIPMGTEFTYSSQVAQGDILTASLLGLTDTVQFRPQTN